MPLFKVRVPVEVLVSTELPEAASETKVCWEAMIGPHHVDIHVQTSTEERAKAFVGAALSSEVSRLQPAECIACGSLNVRSEQMVLASYPPIYVTNTHCLDCGADREQRVRGRR